MSSANTQPSAEVPTTPRPLSLVSLARAVTPVLAGAVFSIFGLKCVFIAAAALTAAAFGMSTRLTRPVR